MSDKTIKDYADAGGIDAAADYFLIQQNSTNTYRRITRNVMLGTTGTPVDTASVQTLQNKVLDNTNTLTIKDTLFTLQDDGDITKQAKFQLSGITTGTTRTYTLPNASSTLADIATSQTFTNKTLTSPVITGGSIDNTTITVDSIAGHTSGTTGTIYGISVTAAKISGTAISSASITSTQLANASVTASKLATGATNATVATSQTTTGATYAVLATSTDSVTITVGANGLALIAIYANMFNSASNNNFMSFAISGANTQVASDAMSLSSFGTGQYNFAATFLITGLVAGSTTFAAQYRTTGGTATFANRRIAVIPL